MLIGMLAAWARIKYPQHFAGAIAVIVINIKPNDNTIRLTITAINRRQVPHFFGLSMFLNVRGKVRI